MPTYDYECEKCGRVFEVFQSITAEPLKTCGNEGCTGTVHRLISSGGGFLLKGSGFYSTDYRSDSYKKAEKADKETTSKSSDSAKTSETAAPSTTPSTTPGTRDSAKPGSSS
jgi:putative FmdB family regulatory protein